MTQTRTKRYLFQLCEVPLQIFRSVFVVEFSGVPFKHKWTGERKEYVFSVCATLF